MAEGQTFTEVFKKDLLSGSAKFIKDGYMSFDRVVWSKETGEARILFYSGSHHLATMNAGDCEPNSTLTLKITAGQMRIFVHGYGEEEAGSSTRMVCRVCERDSDSCHYSDACPAL